MRPTATGDRILTKSRAMEYLTLDGLTKMIGVPVHELDVYTVKELVDNALDAAELTPAAPDIVVTLAVVEAALLIEVTDAGVGMSAAMVREVTNLERFGGTKYFVKRPIRGAQGNALMTIVGLVAALWRDQGLAVPPPITIAARGDRNDVRLRLNVVLERAVAEVARVKISESAPAGDVAHGVAPGTHIRVILPLAGANGWGDPSRYRRVLEEFAVR